MAEDKKTKKITKKTEKESTLTEKEVAEELKQEETEIDSMNDSQLDEDEDFEIDFSVNDKDGYFEAIGRRKTSTARIRVTTKGSGKIVVNGKDYDKYFTTKELQEVCVSALKKMKCQDKFDVSVKVSGGGINSQAEAIRHGISRALVSFNAEFKKRLRRAGYLTRDSRQRERKKFGLKRARRAPQWKKR